MRNEAGSERQPLWQFLLHATLGVVAVAIFVGGLWHTLKLNERERREAEAAAKRPKKAPPAPPPPEVRTVEASGEWTSPSVAVGTTETAEAMDLTGLRFQLSRLRMSALEGNPAGRESAAAGIKLYGEKAAKFLDEEIAREPDAVVRAALVDARKGLK